MSVYAVCRLLEEPGEMPVYYPAVDIYSDDYTTHALIDAYLHDNPWALVEVHSWIDEGGVTTYLDLHQEARWDGDIVFLEILPTGDLAPQSHQALVEAFGLHVPPDSRGLQQHVDFIRSVASRAEAAALDDPIRALTAESSSSSDSSSSSSSDARLQTVSTLLEAKITGTLLGPAENYGQAQFDFTVKHEKLMANGTGDGQVNRTFAQNVTVPASSLTVLDLFSLTSTLFDHSETIEFVNVKKIVVKNASATAGDDVYVKPTTANRPFNSPFRQHNPSRLEIPAGSALVLTNSIPGWLVNPAAERNLTVQNLSANQIVLNVEITGVE